MSIEQLELMLYEMYVIDIWIPTSTFYKTDFKKASYSIWVIDELKKYIVDGLYPRNSGKIDDFIKLTDDFINKTRTYSKIDSKTNLMFSIAQNIATDILDLLCAMK